MHHQKDLFSNIFSRTIVSVQFVVYFEFCRLFIMHLGMYRYVICKLFKMVGINGHQLFGFYYYIIFSMLYPYIHHYTNFYESCPVQALVQKQKTGKKKKVHIIYKLITDDSHSRIVHTMHTTTQRISQFIP